MYYIPIIFPQGFFLTHRLSVVFTLPYSPELTFPWTLANDYLVRGGPSFTKRLVNLAPI